MMRRQIVAFMFVSVPLSAILIGQEVALNPQLSSPGRPASGVDLDVLDRSADACADFYQFASGGWIAANPVPPDRQRWGRFAELHELNFTILRRILETPDADSDRRKASDYYDACLDERAIEAEGLAPLEPELARVAALARKEDLPPIVAQLHSIGLNALFRFGSRADLRDATTEIAKIDQGGLGLPDGDCYLKTDARSVDLKQKCQDHVQKMLVLLGDSPEQAASGARAVVAIETALASAALDRVLRRDAAATDHDAGGNPSVPKRARRERARGR